MQAELEKCTELADRNNNIVKTAVLARGDIFVLLPKFHPELAPIERCWSQLKARLAELNSREKNTSPDQLKHNMYTTWKIFNDNHLDTIRRYFGRMFRFVQVTFSPPLPCFLERTYHAGLR
jgi:transposase